MLRLELVQTPLQLCTEFRRALIELLIDQDAQHRIRRCRGQRIAAVGGTVIAGLHGFGHRVGA